ncbi:ABC transporter permease [Staphylococcus auricularis]|uniref:ABC-2 type transporter transmembrane domain-containing protein n=1 Tax=Staphylococcus auricularis TaxID=29379 RepID=A0ABX5IC80_9STAP|nr:ABC transporter permease [Staphylococcus auricularis]MCE5038933.1 ABC transporter permease [Staphylococcus auricularis]MEB6570734.1 ABC transporter permease [Staphylococcus auricularis]PTH13376.1 hypothetical protein BU607_09700 [Staphylococcus auricularis]PTH26532.1 hypothetical protein BU608_03905 [Staphylococcus auricularis]
MEIKKLMYYFKIEILRFLREPISLFFTLIFPIILIYIFGNSFGDVRNHTTQTTYYNSLVAIDISFLIANFTLMGIGNDLAAQKESGVYYHLKLLPLNHWTKVIVESAAYLFLLFLSIVLIIVFVFLKYEEISFRGSAVLFITFILISYFTFVSIIRYIVSFDYSARTLQLISSSVFFILLFVSGIIIPKGSLPLALKNIVDFSPVYIIFNNLEGIWNGTMNLNYFLLSLFYFMSLMIIFNLLIRMKRKAS